MSQLEKNLKNALLMILIYSLVLIIINFLNIYSTGFDENNVRGLLRSFVFIALSFATIKGNVTARNFLFWGSFILASLSLVTVILIFLGYYSLDTLTQGHAFPLFAQGLTIISFTTSIAAARYMFYHRRAVKR